LTDHERSQSCNNCRVGKGKKNVIWGEKTGKFHFKWGEIGVQRGDTLFGREIEVEAWTPGIYILPGLPREGEGPASFKGWG